jgi:hypothetical protein
MENIRDPLFVLQLFENRVKTLEYEVRVLWDIIKNNITYDPGPEVISDSKMPNNEMIREKKKKNENNNNYNSNVLKE